MYSFLDCLNTFPKDTLRVHFSDFTCSEYDIFMYMYSVHVFTYCICTHGLSFLCRALVGVGIWAEYEVNQNIGQLVDSGRDANSILQGIQDNVSECCVYHR